MDLTDTTVATQPDQPAVPSHKTRYRTVNGTWPDNLPIPTGPEALTACKLLYRKFRGQPYRGKWELTSGRRYTWPRGGVFYVNPNRHGRGWHHIVHMMSHLVWRRLFPNAKPHAPGHAHLEKQMIEHVVNSGWLDGKLRRAKKAAAAAPVDPKVARLLRLKARLKKWQARERRAENAVQKLKHQINGYERRGVTIS